MGRDNPIGFERVAMEHIPPNWVPEGSIGLPSISSSRRMIANPGLDGIVPTKCLEFPDGFLITNPLPFPCPL
jgi:hypothetical protein